MILDRLTSAKNHTHLDTTLDRLLTNKTLPKPVRNYLISCKIENKSQRTIEVYTMVLSEFTKSTSLDTITANDIRLFLLSLMHRNLKPSTIHIYYRGIKTFFNWMVREGLISISPFINIKAPKLPKIVIMPFSNQDIQNLLSLCNGVKFLDLRNRAMFLTFLDTGIRLEEMARIQIPDINFDNETVKIHGKGSKERYVRIGQGTQRALLKYLVSRNDDLPALWLTEERHPMTWQGVDITTRRYCKAAVVSGARPSAHTFRHTAAISCLRNGMNIVALQVMLGHSSIETTRRYLSSLGIDDIILEHRKASPVDKMGIK